MKLNYNSCSREELVEALKAQEEINKKQAEENQRQQRKIEQLEFDLTQLKRLVYGRKSERFVPDVPPEQMRMVFSGAEPDPEAGQQDLEKIQYERKKPNKQKKQPARQPLPEHLPREDTVIEPAGDTTGMKCIGEEVTEELEYEPGKIYVKRTIRPKYVDPDNEDNGVTIAVLPSRPIDKGIAGPGLLSRVIVDKYLDHLPLYRQAKRFKREEIPLPRSTLGDWVRQCADLLSPLYEKLKETALTADYLQVDESGIRVLTRDKPDSSVKGCMLVHHAPVKRLCFFKYTRTKEKVRILEALRGYSGYLQVDGNVSYEEKGQQDDVTLLNCWAHARRKFDQALDNDKDRASHALYLIQNLYAIERHARDEGLDAAGILALRQKQAVPVLDALFKWLDAQYDQVLPKSVIGNAIQYTLRRQEALRVYTIDGKLLIDNNLVENLIRPLALGRKNYLFAGSHDAAQRSAVFYSLFATCKLNDIEPFTWLRDILTRIKEHPINRIEELLPVVGYQLGEV